MLFSSFTFIFVFLPIVWAVFHLLKRARFKAHYKSAKIFLILSSLFFYAFWKVAYLPILLGSIIINYALAKAILKQSLVIKSNATASTAFRGGVNQHLDSSTTSSLRGSNATEAIQNNNIDCHESLRDSRNDEVERNESTYNSHNDDKGQFDSFHNNNSRFTPKFYFVLGIIFNLSLLAFFKYTDFLLENFNAFSKLTHLDFDIPLPHILLPLALSFVTFQQIAFLFDCYKRTNGELDENLHIDFIDYALFISFFPQLIAGPIVHHREMMPQFAKMGANSACGDFSQSASAHSLQRTPSASHSFASHNHENSLTILEFASCNGIVKNDKNNPSLRGEAKAIQTEEIDCHDFATQNLAMTEKGSCVDFRNDELKSTINYEFLAKGIFIFSIGLFKKAFIADSFAKWANAGFKAVESGGFLNIAESWATSLSYTFQLYFDFSGYCDMAIGLAIMFGIVLPLNFDSPYKSLNIAEFWRRWHITLGIFLKECVYIPLGGNRVGKILNLRNLFIVAFLSGIWHGAGWGFVIWGVLHGVAMVIHRIYSWWLDSLANYKKLSLQRQNQSATSSLRESRSDSWQSKTSDSNQSQSVISQKRIDKLHKFTQSKKIKNDSQVVKVDCFGLPKASLAMTSRDSSLRGSVSEANTTKHINYINQHIDCQTGKLACNNKIMDCHDFATQNLAMTEKGSCVESCNDNNVQLCKLSRNDSNRQFCESLRNDEKVARFLKSHNDGLFIRFTKTRFYKFLCWFITFNFVNLAWIFFRAENLNGAVNLIKGMFGIVWVELPQEAYKANHLLKSIDGTDRTFLFIIVAFIVCIASKNSFEKLQNFSPTWTNTIFAVTLAIIALISLLANDYTPFLYFNF